MVGTTILASHVGVARHNFAAMMAIRGFCGHKSFEILQSCLISKAESGHIVCREPFSKNDDKSILA